MAWLSVIAVGFIPVLLDAVVKKILWLLHKGGAMALVKITEERVEAIIKKHQNPEDLDVE